MLWLGGTVGVEGQSARVDDVQDLPGADFRLDLVDLVGCNILPPDLERLAGLEALRVLNLPGPMWNPRAGARTDYSRDLKHIAPVSTLEELTISYSFLAYIKFQDDGLEEIAGLEKLKLLSLENTQVAGHQLAPFKNIESLDLTYTPSDDEALEQLADKAGLRRLLLDSTLVTDDGLAHLSGLSKLEYLDLGSTRVGDAGVAHLAGLVNMRKLDLLGADLTDDGLKSLAGMTRLEELNLYRTKVTNVGLDQLKNLKSLRQIDLRYSRASQSGVDSLQAALPEARINFLDVSVRPSIPEGADRVLSRRAPRSRCRLGAHARRLSRGRGRAPRVFVARLNQRHRRASRERRRVDRVALA